MKLWIGILLVAVFLGASASVLLSTDQAPLPLPPKEEAPAVEAAAPPPPPEKAVMTTEEFRTLGAEVMSALPSRENFRKGVDLPILAAADLFVKLNEAVGEEAGLQAEAMTLYQECANSGQYQDGVRALCFWNLRALAKKTGKQLGRSSAPPHIRNLADQL
jgi:hypothetical protein